MSYMPSSLIEAFHSIPRYGISLKSVPNELPSLDFSEGSPGFQYLEGVLLQAGGFWGLAVLVFVVYGLTYAFSCCCKRQQFVPTDKERAAKGVCKRNCGPRCGYMVSVLSLTGGLLAAIIFVAKYSEGTSDAITALNNVENLLGNCSTWVNADLMGALNNTDTAVLDLQAVAVANGAPAGLQAQIADVLTAVQSGRSSVQGLGNTLTEVVGDLSSQIVTQNPENPLDVPTSTSYVNLGAAKYGLSIGAWILLGLSLFWFLLQAVTMRATKCAAKGFKFMLFFTLVASVLVMVFTGLVYAVSMVGSDICVAPADGISRALNGTGNGAGSAADLASSSLLYYANCVADPTLPPSGAYATAVDSSEQLVSAFVSLEVLNAAVAGDPTYQPLVDAISANLTSANGTLQLLTTSISCVPVSNLWNSLLTGLCNGAITGVAEMTCALIGAVAGLLLLLSFGAALCYNHPGDAIDVDEATKDVSSVAAVRSSNPYANYQTAGAARGQGTRFSSGPASVSAVPTAGSAGIYEWK